MIAVADAQETDNEPAPARCRLRFLSVLLLMLFTALMNVHGLRDSLDGGRSQLQLS